MSEPDDGAAEVEEQKNKSQEVYQWTGSRIAIALLIVLMGAGIPSYVFWKVYLEPASGGRNLVGAARMAMGADPMKLDFDLENLQIEKGQILSGGPPMDGIPSLRTDLATKPEAADESRNPGQGPTKVVSLAEATDIKLTARVVGVVVNGEARAYPIGILNFHEAVNDILGDTPICVVYCPLCDSVTVVDRRMDDEVLEFGISGLLANSNVLMYDRTHKSLWSQVRLTAVSGPYAGRSLKHLDNWRITTLGKWQAAHPDTTIISTDTGHPRDYSRSPYSSYFDSDMLMFPADPGDSRIERNKTPVVGIKLGDAAVAYPVEAIQQAPEGTINTTIGGQPVILKADEDGEVQIVSVPEDALVVHTFWFAWAAFHQGTDIYQPEAE